MSDLSVPDTSKHENPVCFISFKQVSYIFDVIERYNRKNDGKEWMMKAKLSSLFLS